MTEAQLEKAARRLCEMHGEDPDSLVAAPSRFVRDREGIVDLVHRTQPLWHRYADELRAHYEREQVIKEAMT